MRKRDEGGWSSIETLAALFIVVIASAAIGAAATSASKAGIGLSRRVSEAVTASNGKSDAIIALFSR